MGAGYVAAYAYQSGDPVLLRIGSGQIAADGKFNLGFDASLDPGVALRSWKDTAPCEPGEVVVAPADATRAALITIYFTTTPPGNLNSNPPERSLYLANFDAVSSQPEVGDAMVSWVYSPAPARVTATCHPLPDATVTMDLTLVRGWNALVQRHQVDGYSLRGDPVTSELAWRWRQAGSN